MILSMPPFEVLGSSEAYQKLIPLICSGDIELEYCDLNYINTLSWTLSTVEKVKIILDMPTRPKKADPFAPDRG